MENSTATVITVETTVSAPVNKVWDYWTKPEHITQWCFASDDWHCPKAENDIKTGGKFSSTMAAKDGSFSFDFGGVYDKVEPNKFIAYTMGDGRQAEITFTQEGSSTKVVEKFHAESQNPIEMQKGGWQAILDNFKKHVENN
ncbi:MAG TPA: SRPBCC family protein [Bacteroidia bacterium]